MKYLAQTKKTIILSAFVSIMGFSLVSSSQTHALSLRDITTGLLGGSQQNQTPAQTSNNSNNTSNQTPRQTLVPTITQQVPVVTQQPVVTPQPTQTAQTTVSPTQTSVPQQAPATQTTDTKAPVTQTSIAPIPLDTAADVFKTASAQSVNKSASSGSPYTTNKINPELGKQLLFASLATITAGALIYAATILPQRKHVRHIPVKSL